MASTKDKVLALLEQHRGQSISGEEMARELGVSRNAVWKAARELKKAGHDIEAVTNRGYMLSGGDDILSVQGMLPYLSHEETAANISVYQTIDSTNRTAKEMALSGAPHGTVVIADEQTSGKGRYGRLFHSPAGSGIYMSFILRPDAGLLETPTLITAFAAALVCEAIEELTGTEPRIKWVNDIYLGGKKICGILTEAVSDFESGRIEWLVVGIGINYREPAGGFPAELRDIAGAIYADGVDAAAEMTRNRLAAAVVEKMLNLGARDSAELLKEYKARLFMLGSEISVVSVTGAYDATALDLDDKGQLIVKTPDGEIRTLSSGEISIRI